MSLSLRLSDFFFFTIRLELWVSGKNTTQRKYPSWHDIGCILPSYILTSDINPHRFVKVVFVARFLDYEVTVFSFSYCTLWSKSLSSALTQESRRLCSTSWRKSIYLDYLKFCYKDLSLLLNLKIYATIYLYQCVGWKQPPKDVHVLTPKAYNYVTLYGKSDFANRLGTLKWKIIPRLSG